MIRRKCSTLTCSVLVALFLVVPAQTAYPADEGSPDAWREDWALLTNFTMEIDTVGFDYPTSIAFVPNPGPNPNDPLYYVSEMEGAIKVVTNDRTVHTFASDFFPREFDPPRKLPDKRAESGLAAIALDPATGYIFGSFAYTGDEQTLRNDIVRFSTTPGTFSLEPTESVRFTDVFKNFPTSRSHQIGHMVVDGDSLWVGVGDGMTAGAPQDLDTVNGKVLRLTLDGEPWPDNPFRTKKAGDTTARDYVWSLGFRNPFGMVRTPEGLFVVENGPSVDRLVRIERGRNYGYDGTDWSMGLNAIAVVAPSVGPVQTAWLPVDDELFPLKYRNSFFVTFGGSPSKKGPGQGGERSVVYWSVDANSGKIYGPPRIIASYRGNANQMPVGAAFGPDGLYIVPIYPIRGEESGVIRIAYDPDGHHPHRIGSSESPIQLMSTYGCDGCHMSYGQREAIAPSLHPPTLIPRVYERISSEEYLREVEELDALTSEPFASFSDERGEILSLEGKEKVTRWIKYHLLEPKFDNREALMPDQGLSDTDAQRLAEYFADAGWDVGEPGLKDRIIAALRETKDRPPRWRWLIAASALFGLAGLVIGFAFSRRLYRA